MRAFVTGATGFVGRHLVAHLETAGDEVVGVRGTDVDVTDAAAIRQAIVDAQPDAVYHLAALSHVGDSWDAPGRVFRVNAEGTLNVLRASSEVGVARALVVGSADEYGSVREADLPLSEDAPLRPLTPYGASKVAADFLALQAFLGDGLGAIRVRSFNHTGPGQDERFVVPSIARRIALAERDGQGEISIGSLDAVRDYADVRDVVRAYRLLVTEGTPGEVYNVCTGTGRAVGDLVEAMLRMTEAAIRPVVDPALVRPVEVPRLVGDPSKIRDAIGWLPEIEFEQTLADVLADQRDAVTG